MDLKDILTWLASSGGAGAVAYFVLAQLEKRYPDWSPTSELKRYLAFAISGVLGACAFLAMVGLQYEPTPIGWQSWVEQIMSYILTAIGVAQILHARLQLASKRRA